MLCSVIKHAGSGRARKKIRGKHETQSSVFPHFLSALPLPKWFTTEHSTNFIFQRSKSGVSLYKSLVRHAKISQSQSLLELFK